MLRALLIAALLSAEPSLSLRLGALTDQIHSLSDGPQRDALVKEHRQLAAERQAQLDGRCVGPHVVTRETRTCPCGLDDQTFAAVTKMLLRDCGGCRRSEVWTAPPGPPCHGKLLGISAPTPIPPTH